MQIITRAVLVVGVFACLVLSVVQATAAKKPKGPACEVVNGTCVSVSCTECGPIFPQPCACISN
jgi:hypothetical protein